MIKIILLCFMSLGLVACTADDEQYYITHPKALQQAMHSCPGSSKVSISCAQLENIAKRLQRLGYQLRNNPQEYGKRILELQELVARQKASLRENMNQVELKNRLLKNQRLLQEHIAVVKWLESPES